MPDDGAARVAIATGAGLSSTAASGIAPPFHFGVPVWGADYVDMLVSACLPTLLAPGNIPALSSLEQSRFTIHTSCYDYRAIVSSRSFKLLERSIDVEFRFIEWPVVEAHKVMTNAYNAVMKDAAEVDGLSLFITPDLILSDGSLRYIEDAVTRRHKRMILVSGVRLDKQRALAPLCAATSPDGSISMDGRSLVRVMMPRLHAITRSLFSDSTAFNVHPSHIYVGAGDGGFAAMCFHLHPLAVMAGALPSTTTIDDDLASAPEWTDQQIEVIDDSDKVTCFEISPLSHRVGNDGPNVLRTDAVVAWARHFVRNRHLDFFRHTIMFHQGNRTDPRFDQAVERANSIRAKIMEAMTSRDAGPEFS